MYAQVEKPKENKSRAVANSVGLKIDRGVSLQFVDNRELSNFSDNRAIQRAIGEGGLLLNGHIVKDTNDKKYKIISQIEWQGKLQYKLQDEGGNEFFVDYDDEKYDLYSFGVDFDEMFREENDDEEMCEEENDDDNISIYSDFEDSNDEKIKKIWGEKKKGNKQQIAVGNMRIYLEEHEDDLDFKSFLGTLTGMANDQTTTAFARKIEDRKPKSDHFFSTKLSTKAIKYLSCVLTGKEEFDAFERGKSRTNEKHAEVILAKAMKDKGLDLSEYELFISRPRCDYCKDDAIVNEFGFIHEPKS